MPEAELTLPHDAPLPRHDLGPDPEAEFNQRAQADRDQADDHGLTAEIAEATSRGQTHQDVIYLLGDKLNFLPPEDRPEFVSNVRATLSGEEAASAWLALRNEETPAAAVADSARRKQDFIVDPRPDALADAPLSPDAGTTPPVASPAAQALPPAETPSPAPDQADLPFPVSAAPQAPTAAETPDEPRLNTAEENQKQSIELPLNPAPPGAEDGPRRPLSSPEEQIAAFGDHPPLAQPAENPGASARAAERQAGVSLPPELAAPPAQAPTIPFPQNAGVRSAAEDPAPAIAARQEASSPVQPARDPVARPAPPAASTTPAQPVVAAANAYGADQNTQETRQTSATAPATALATLLAALRRPSPFDRKQAALEADREPTVGSAEPPKPVSPTGNLIGRAGVYVNDRIQPDRDAKAVTAAQTAGSQAMQSLAAVEKNHAASILERMRDAATNNGGMEKVMSEMAPGGAFEDLRKEFDRAMSEEPGFQKAYDKAANDLSSYATHRGVVAEISKARPATSLGKLETIDREIVTAAAQMPGKEAGKSALDEAAEKAKEIFKDLVDAIRGAFTHDHGNDAHSRPSPSPSPGP